jgi:ABC-type glutathione transport system ATPase component
VADRKIKLSIRDVSKTYGAVTALADASLELSEGEFLTLLGPSGSGKTTLLMMLAGLVQPSGGEIWIDGKLATYAPPNKRDIGIVFQNYALFPHLTVRENIAFPLRMRRVPEATIAAEVSGSSTLCSFPMSRTGCRVRSPAASSSASRSPAAWSIVRRSSSWTSRWARSTGSCATTCSSRSRSCTAGSALPSSTSRTTRRRRWRCPTASAS